MNRELLIAQHKNVRQLGLDNAVRYWLDNLDELSDEGLWFDDFAKNFTSRFEAAKVYLNQKEV